MNEDVDATRAAGEALREIRRSREVSRLVAAFHAEINESRRWILLDAALDFGYPGTGAVKPWPDWVAQLAEGIPHFQSRYLVDKVKKRREKLVAELKRRSR